MNALSEIRKTPLISWLNESFRNLYIYSSDAKDKYAPVFWLYAKQIPAPDASHSTLDASMPATTTVRLAALLYDHVPTIVAVFVVQLSPVDGEMECVKIGDGLIVIAKTSSTDGQLFNCTLTVIVALMLFPVVFCGAIHVGKSPVPEFPIPMEGLELLHEIEAPAGVEI